MTLATVVPLLPALASTFRNTFTRMDTGGNSHNIGCRASWFFADQPGGAPHPTFAPCRPLLHTAHRTFQSTLRTCAPAHRPGNRLLAFPFAETTPPVPCASRSADLFYPPTSTGQPRFVALHALATPHKQQMDASLPCPHVQPTNLLKNLACAPSTRTLLVSQPISRPAGPISACHVQPTLAWLL